MGTIRTRQAVDARGVVPIVRDLLKHDGLRGVYRGIESKSMLPISEVTATACLAGSFGASVCSPFEMIKSRAQLDLNASKRKNPGNTSLIRREMDEISMILRTKGVVGFCRGVPLLLMRDFHATGVFLGSYEVIRRYCERWNFSPYQSAIISGAIAGPFGWITCYPVEVLRLHYQGHPEFTSYRSCAGNLYKTQGFVGFWRGLPMCCVRSAFQIAGTMAVFEELRAYFA